MIKLLILYPNLFNCYSKFSRKIEKITSGLDNVTLIYPSDPNEFIKKICDNNSHITSCENLVNWTIDDLTHAIVFDDGKEFPKETALLQSSGKPVRVIKIAITRVINIKTKNSIKNSLNYEYIGRGSYWGNPHSMYEKGDERDEVIRKYKYDFDFDKFPNKKKSEVYKLAGKQLGCFCKPQTCHGDILADFLNAWDDGK
ncbi:DUF4326 domain-containing protein [Thiofilum flexile]|uniref:DUF4326 domain-containing protein n=1 Tax=Thiofilum flexile TaxID=125627 RepID=UPI00036A6647|nr:DUF4326 domain-containing protein [Thiofilum flexile]